MPSNRPSEKELSNQALEVVIACINNKRVLDGKEGILFVVSKASIYNEFASYFPDAASAKLKQLIIYAGN